MRSGWWLRLHWRRWICALGDRPLRRAATLLLWWVPSLLLPAALSVDPQLAGQALDFLASLDIPLTLLLATGVTLDAIGANASVEAEQWLWSPAFRPRSTRWLMRVHWLLAARWPAGLALATALLSARAVAGQRATGELYLMAALALLAGVLFIWMRWQRGREGRPGSGRPRLARGTAALSWAPIHEARDRLDSRRVGLLLVPVLLAAPMNAQVGRVFSTLLLVIAAAFVVTVCRECSRVHSSLTAWLAAAAWTRARIALLVWRHVLAGLVVVASLWLLWMVQGRQLMDSAQ